MSSHHRTIHVRTQEHEGLEDITELVVRTVAEIGRHDGIVTVFCPHTTAAVTINENADPDVQADIIGWLRRMVPADPGFRHIEGNSDAHIKSSLVGATVQAPLVGGKLLLGRWQGIYFCEFDGPRLRRVEVIVT